jgi:hypothetical protein
VLAVRRGPDTVGGGVGGGGVHGAAEDGEGFGLVEVDVEGGRLRCVSGEKTSNGTDGERTCIERKRGVDEEWTRIERKRGVNGYRAGQ